MKKSKIILLFKLFVIVIFFIYLFIFYNKKNYSIYKGNETTFIGFINKIEKKEDKTVFYIKTKENILVNYYGENIDFKIGDYVEIKGTLSLPKNNSNFHLFNYKKYLLSKKIYYILNADSIKLLKNNDKWYYKLKQNLINKIDKLDNSTYLKSFILGDSSDIEMDSYQANGVSHLFAISGMHITLITIFLSKLLLKFNKCELLNNILISIFLIIYIFITSFSVSVIRASLMFIFSKINKYLKLNLKTVEILILIAIILLFINPFYIYSLSFKFSFIISLYLIIFSNLINKRKNYFTKLLMTSFIAFLVGFPIQVNGFYGINLLSIFMNIIFVPIFTFLVFPLGIFTFFIPFFSFLFEFVITYFEKLSLFFSNINIFKLDLAYLSSFFFIYYYIIITLLFSCNKKILLFIIFIISLLIHYNITYFKFYHRVTTLDVGQGDSLLINLKNNKGNILIDTGGKYNSSYNMTENIIIPYLKSIGIRKLDYLFLTHGDYDHMGEAINLVENFKVEKVIFNCGELNELEQELIKVLNKKKIPYYSCIKELNIDDNKLYFLNNKEYGNENDNSSVIYTELNNHKFLFMGDAGVEVEEDLIEKYNLQDIDVLKVGHHGSKTSSSKIFIDEINPKYSIISVGKNNRYGHPNDSVLDNLEDSKIYRTDYDGSIMFKIKNNKLQIETCTP